MNNVPASISFPAYQQGMLPNEIMELVESSLTTLMGAGTLVEASNLRPQALDGKRGAMFDLRIQATDEPVRTGRALAFVEDLELHLFVFIAPELHYFDKHWEAARAVMLSARAAPAG
jgi:hypothetical protein